MNRLIIVEGPDCVGKSTFIQQLKNEMSSKYIIHIRAFSGPVSKNDQEQYTEQRTKFFNSYDECCELLKDPNNMIILDRSYVGEFVYSNIYKRPHPFYMRELHAKFITLDPLYIFIKGTPILTNATNQDKYLSTRFNDVVLLFEEFFADFAPHKVLMFDSKHFISLNERNNYIIKCVIANTIENNGKNIYAGTYHNPMAKVISTKIHHPFHEYQLAISLVKSTAIIQPPALCTFKIAMFGEAPGMYGCGYTHIPFYYDSSGMLLRNIFFQLGYNLDTLFVSNIFHSTPPKNKLYDVIQKDFISSINFNHIDTSSAPDWLKLEMKLFKADVDFAIQHTQIIVAVGRTAYNVLKQLRKQCNYKYTIIFVYHPAYFLYKGFVNQAFGYYQTKVKDFIPVLKVNV